MKFNQKDSALLKLVTCRDTTGKTSKIMAKELERICFISLFAYLTRLENVAVEGQPTVESSPIIDFQSQKDTTSQLYSYLMSVDRRLQEQENYIRNLVLRLSVSYPSCSSDVTGGSVVVGKNVKLTCTVEHKCNLAQSVGLKMVWTDANGTPLNNSVTTRNGSIMTSHISIKSRHPSVPSYTCRVFEIEEPGHAFTCSTPTVPVVCPQGFQFVSRANSCYQIVFQLRSWSSAIERCEQIYSGSYGAVITSSTEQSAIETYLQSQLQLSASSVCNSSSLSGSIWISGQKEVPNCSSNFTWKPAIGRTIPLTYTNWLSGEPNCKARNEFCLHIWPARNYTWNDQQCIDRFCFLCEYDLF